MTQQARYIKPEVIRIGDTIRVTWEDSDITYTRVGTVAKRDHTNEGTFWYSANENVLLFRDRAMNIGGRITLLESAKELTEMTLEGL